MSLRRREHKMMTAIPRGTLHQAIEQLPDHLLIELAQFIEFLQFKVQHEQQVGDVEEISENHNNGWQTDAVPPFHPVYFPEGILQGFDFSPEYITTVRK